MNAELPKVGDKVGTWFSGQPDGLSTVLAVLPYEGCFPQFFACVLRVTAPGTKSGHAEMAWEHGKGPEVRCG